MNVLAPLLITFETIHLSRDWPSPILQTASYALQQQKEKANLQLLLLKYWSIFAFIWLVLPYSPIYFIFDIIPFYNIVSFGVGCVLTEEISQGFVKFIEEQDKIIGLLQKMDKSTGNFEKVYNVILTTVNFNNNRYMATTFLFGKITEHFISPAKEISLHTNYINSIFDNIILGITYIRNELFDHIRVGHDNLKKSNMGTQQTASESTKPEPKASNSPPNYTANESFFNRFSKSFNREFQKQLPRSKNFNQSSPSTIRELPSEDFEII